MKVLVTALDWGIGHTNRIIPIISKIITRNCDVVFAGSQSQISLLKRIFPNINYIPVSTPTIKYSKGKSQVLSISRFLPNFLKQIRKEKKIADDLVKQYCIDIIISDNCYGFRSGKAYSVFITHQICILLPRPVKFLYPLINFFIKYFINRFDECWIPDIEKDAGFSGSLGHLKLPKIPVSHIGLLSRVDIHKKDNPVKDKIDLLIIISGPEDQRSIFENLILRDLYKIPKNKTWCVLRGLPDKKDAANRLNIKNHADPDEYTNLILKAEKIICRSGYSTIMDLILLKKTAVLVPTPGQTEQEYLALHLTNKGYFLSFSQNTFNLLAAIDALDNFTPEKLPDILTLYYVDQIIDRLIDHKKQGEIDYQQSRKVANN